MSAIAFETSPAEHHMRHALELREIPSAPMRDFWPAVGRIIDMPSDGHTLDSVGLTMLLGRPFAIPPSTLLPKTAPDVFPHFAPRPLPTERLKPAMAAEVATDSDAQTNQQRLQEIWQREQNYKIGSGLLTEALAQNRPVAAPQCAVALPLSTFAMVEPKPYRGPEIVHHRRYARLGLHWLLDKLSR